MPPPQRRPDNASPLWASRGPQRPERPLPPPQLRTPRPAACRSVPFGWGVVRGRHPSTRPPCALPRRSAPPAGGQPSGSPAARPCDALAHIAPEAQCQAPTPPPPCNSPSGCCFFTGPWTVARSSLRMLRRVAAFCRPLPPVLLPVSFPRSRSPVVGVPGLCWLWRDMPFVR